jgi:hypothetical protein
MAELNVWLSWRWMYWVFVPVALVALVLALLPARPARPMLTLVGMYATELRGYPRTTAGWLMVPTALTMASRPF